MIDSSTLRLMFLASMMASSSCVIAFPGERIDWDPHTGDYIIAYWDEEEPASLEKDSLSRPPKSSHLFNPDFEQTKMAPCLTAIW